MDNTTREQLAMLKAPRHTCLASADDLPDCVNSQSLNSELHEAQKRLLTTERSQRHVIRAEMEELDRQIKASQRSGSEFYSQW